MAKAWYVLHVYSGYEAKIEKTIRLFQETGELSKEVVTDVKVPSEVTEKSGKKQSSKILPGYMLLEMDINDVNWKSVTAALKKITGVTGFVGAALHKKPMPITADEARTILQRAGEIKGEKPVRAKQNFAVGEEVKIIDGPFESFSGAIEEVNTEKSKLKVMVGIFGRATPVEVDMISVEKI